MASELNLCYLKNGDVSDSNTAIERLGPLIKQQRTRNLKHKT